MKKAITVGLLLMGLIGLAGCRNTSTISDYPAAIMVDGKIYLLDLEPMSSEVDNHEILGYTTSYTDTFPEQDGETNFNRELEMPYAKVEDGVAVLYDGAWHLCTPQDG